MDITVRCRFSGSPVTAGQISSVPSLSSSQPPRRGSAPVRPKQPHPSSDRKKQPP
ncbi:MAG: hypothetical protein QOH19_680 [Actinomycetota bacterium]|jgi:hypothetical protein|nr:hypothetical protein [Actinomycetota bacterium]